MSDQTPRGRKDSDLRTVYIVIGVVLIVIGLGLLGGVPFFAWTGPWELARGIMHEVRRVGWPLAVIALGVLVIVYSRRPGARLPSRDARLMRSREKRVVAGVLGGLADYFSVDVTLVRVGYVLFAFIFSAWGPLLIAYIVAAIIVPEEPKPGEASASAPPPPPPPGDVPGGGERQE